MDGYLLIDKPKGPSSFHVVKTIRALSGTKKVGHAGTLDPLATGLLVVCLGRYTKLATILTDGDKTYEAVFRLGETSSTDDAEGEITFRAKTSHLDEKTIENTLSQFVGVIDQIPPQFSAIKIGGRRAYDLAREKINIELVARSVEIFKLDIINFSLPEITVRIHCAKGFYVRSLARDLGHMLGVGGYAKEIRRIASGGLSIERAIKLENLNKNNVLNHIIKTFDNLTNLDMIEVDDNEKNNLMHGRVLTRQIASEKKFALALHKNEPIAIYKKETNRMELARVI